jgi:4-amino-4-deoxy-L-arabinose transferase-like glycosyltransferase
MSQLNGPSVFFRKVAERHLDLIISLSLGLLGALIFLPRLGAFPLWDPWEPHYSQVAWEMQNRHTWLEPFYRNTDNWWSKPILMLWLLRASFALFWDSNHAYGAHEFCARLPFALTAIAGAILQYGWVRRLFGRAVGALSAVVLLTSAQYLLIGRQVMVDMLMVVAYGNAMGYLAVGLLTNIAVGGGERSPLPHRFTRLKRTWPFLVFWVLQALAVLAKGFVPPLLAILVVGSFALLTFGSDTRGTSGASRPWSRLIAKRIGGAALLLCVTAFAVRFVLTQATWAKEQRELGLALVIAAAVASAFLVVLQDFGPSIHARTLLSRIGVGWGLPLFLAIAAPWYVYMTARHGWPYWQQFIFFHHLGRAAGTISLPNGTFDFYLRNLGFALYPWTGFLVGSLVIFLGRCRASRGQAEQRNLYLLCLVAAPTAFFMLSGTKFAHYIFPIVPACSVIVAAGLVWLVQRGNAALRGAGAREYRGTVALFGLISCLVFIVLFNDVRHDIRHLLRLFVYYYNRTTPFEYHPAQALLEHAVLVLGTTCVFVFVRRVRTRDLVALGLCGTAFACHLGWVTMPAMDGTYSYKPIYEAYRESAAEGAPIGQYANWPQPERSVLFLFRNQAVHLNSDSAASLFLSRPGRRFVIVDRNRLADLRRVAKQINVPLHVIFDDHPYARLLSTEADPNPKRARRPHVLGELPADVTTTDVNFDGKIRLLGWRASPANVRPGQTAKVTFYYEAIAPIERDYEIFAHGDSPTSAGHRLNADHLPARGSLPTSGWQEGRIIEDEFEVHVPVNYPFESFFVWTGFFIGDDRLQLANSPPNGRDGRARGPLLFVSRDMP